MEFDFMYFINAFAEYFATQIPGSEGMALAYGWLASFFLLTAVGTFAFAIFKREGGSVTVGAIMSFIFVWALPMIWASLAGTGTEEAATEAMRIVMSMS